MTNELILQWNLHGLTNNLDELKHLVKTFSPFCLALQETLLLPGKLVRIPGYTQVSKEEPPRIGGHAHGGVALYVRKNIQACPLPLPTGLQAVAISVESPIKCTICCLYLPNQDWEMTDIDELLTQLPSPFILLGDFNIHNRWWGSNHTDRKGRDFEDIITNKNLVLLNTGSPTHFNCYHGSFSAIDLTVASNSLAATLSWEVLPDLHNSDHFPILIKSPIRQTPVNFPRKWVLAKADWELFQKSWQAFPVSQSIDVNISMLTQSIVDAAEVAIPQSGGRLPRLPVPWWTDECRLAVVAKKRAFALFKRHLSIDNLIAFKRARAKERQVRLHAKRSSWRAYVSSITVDTPVKELWRKVRSISGKTSPSFTPIIVSPRGTITSHAEVGNAIASYFASITSSSWYSDSFKVAKQTAEGAVLNFDSPDPSPYDDPFSMAEFVRALNSKKDKAPGQDRIVVSMIKNLPLAGRSLVLQILNSIFASGVYPDVWRTSIVLPLLKEGKPPGIPSSYRPISLTSCLSKLLETLVNYRLIFFLETNSLLSPYQAGFRKNYSTLDHLALIESQLLNSFQRGQHGVGVFFDIEKAYDTTWRYGILRKLRDWGLRGQIPRLIQSFLDKRFFQVRIGNSLSDIHVQENGIPQGSVLSVTLFAVAINGLADDLPPYITKMLYVDDLAILMTGSDISAIGRILQSHIDNLAKKADALGFRFSDSKTKCVHFCRKRKPHHDPPIILNNRPLQYENGLKFLGLLLDKKLTWGLHLDKLASRVKSSLNILRLLSNTKWGSDHDVLKTILLTKVRGLIDYGSPVYCSARPTRLRKIERLFNYGVRLVTGALRTSPLSHLYHQSMVTPLTFRREHLLCNYVAKIKTRKFHPLYTLACTPPGIHEFILKPTRPRPLFVRHALLTGDVSEPSSGETESTVLDTPSGPLFPWRLPKPEVDWNLFQLKKSSTPDSVYRQLFLHTTAQTPPSHLIFTDGSKTETGAGFSVIWDDLHHSHTLPLGASSYTAELNAITTAVKILYDGCTTGHFYICTDSASSLQRLEDTLTDDTLLRTTIARLAVLDRRNAKVTFLWIPGHAGIEGNEVADSAAKAAAAGLVAPDLPLPLEDRLHLLKAKSRNWFSGVPRGPPVMPYLSMVGGRMERTVLLRVAIGHTRLTHSYLLTNDPQPFCRDCQTVLTIDHIFNDCRTYSRQRHCSNITTLKSLVMNKDFNKIIQFLKDTDLFPRI